MIMVNNSVPPAYLGRVNGISQSVAALARSFGPALAGEAWTLGVKSHMPGHEYAAFGLVCVMQLVALVVSCFLPTSLEKSATDSSGTNSSAQAGEAEGATATPTTRGGASLDSSIELTRGVVGGEEV